MTTDQRSRDTRSSSAEAPRRYRNAHDASHCPTAVVIEDDDDVRALLVEILESAGYATDACTDGAAGVETVLATSPDLVTVDVNLPGIDGLEAVRRIRSAGATMHIIIISGLQDEADKVFGFTAGADDYVTKPFRVRELRARVDALTRRATRRR